MKYEFDFAYVASNDGMCEWGATTGGLDLIIHFDKIDKVYRIQERASGRVLYSKLYTEQEVKKIIADMLQTDSGNLRTNGMEIQ